MRRATPALKLSPSARPSKRATTLSSEKATLPPTSSINPVPPAITATPVRLRLPSTAGIVSGAKVPSMRARSPAVPWRAIRRPSGSASRARRESGTQSMRRLASSPSAASSRLTIGRPELTPSTRPLPLTVIPSMPTSSSSSSSRSSTRSRAASWATRSSISRAGRTALGSRAETSSKPRVPVRDSVVSSPASTAPAMRSSWFQPSSRTSPPSRRFR